MFKGRVVDIVVAEVAEHLAVIAMNAEVMLRLFCMKLGVLGTSPQRAAAHKHARQTQMHPIMEGSRRVVSGSVAGADCITGHTRV